MIKKRIYIIIIGIILILALLAVNFLVNWENPAVPEFSAAQTNQISIFTTDALITEISANNSVGEYTIVSNNTEEPSYSVLGLTADIPLNQELLKYIVNSTTNINAIVIKDNSEGELANFGLEKPATVDIKFADSSSKTLYIGANTPDGVNVYAQIKGDNSIYAIAYSSVSNFLIGKLDLIHPTITQIATSGILFDTATFTGPAYSEPFTIKRTPPIDDSSSSVYNIVSPINHAVDPYYGVIDLQSLLGMIASDIVAIKPDDETMQRLGLLEPFATVELNGTVEGNFKLIASAPDSSNEFYLMRQGIPLVYRMPASSIKWLNISLSSLADKVILDAFLEDLAEINASTPQKEYGLAINGTIENLEVSLNNAPIDVELFRSFFLTLTDGTVEEYNNSIDFSKEPMLTVSFIYKDKRKPKLIRFYESDARQVLVRFDDENYSWSTSSTYVNALIQELYALK